MKLENIDLQQPVKRNESQHGTQSTDMTVESQLTIAYRTLVDSVVTGVLQPNTKPNRIRKASDPLARIGTVESNPEVVGHPAGRAAPVCSVLTWAASARFNSNEGL